jgi:hypothetical protein
MQRGYVKLWRRSIDNGWLQNHLLWSFWCWCLLKASHKQTEITVGYQRVVLEPGQFVFGRNNAAKELRASPQNIRTCVQTLTKTQNLTIKSTNKFSIISIINWESYQQDENKTNHQTNKPLTSNQPATNHKQTHKHKSTKEKRIKTSVSADFCLTETMMDFANRKGITLDLIAFTEEFVRKCQAKDYQYVNWYAAWQDWLVRKWEDEQKKNPCSNGPLLKVLPGAPYGN